MGKVGLSGVTGITGTRGVAGVSGGIGGNEESGGNIVPGPKGWHGKVGGTHESSLGHFLHVRPAVKIPARLIS